MGVMDLTLFVDPCFFVPFLFLLYDVTDYFSLVS